VKEVGEDEGSWLLEVVCNGTKLEGEVRRKFDEAGSEAGTW
jgi:hypothetical protein